MNQYQNQSEPKPLEEILQEADEEEAYNKEVNKEKAKRQKKKDKSFDWKMFIKRFSQVGVVSCLVLAGASIIYEKYEDSKYASEYTQKIQTLDELPTGDNVVGSSLSNDFTLNGDYYVLPCSLQSFFDNGWTVEEYYEDKLSDDINTYGTSIYLENNGSKLYVTVESLTGKKTKVQDGYVTYVSVEENEVENLEISGNITFDTTEEEFNSFTSTLNQDDVYFHEYDDYSYYTIHLDNDEDEPFNYSYTVYLEDKPGGVKKISEINMSCRENYLYQLNQE